MVQFYNHKIEALTYPVSAKAKKFVELHCIKAVGDHWECGPIQGYNTRTYTIIRNDTGFRCNCQGCHKRGHCSHIEALNEYLRQTNSPLQDDLFNDQQKASAG